MRSEGAITIAAATVNQLPHAAADWFPAASRTILGKDAGLHLHYATGYPERSCYYYASGERAMPAHFLRKLIHSDHGEPFFHAFMEGSTAPWWIDMQRRLRNADKLDRMEWK